MSRVESKYPKFEGIQSEQQREAFANELEVKVRVDMLKGETVNNWPSIIYKVLDTMYPTPTKNNQALTEVSSIRTDLFNELEVEVATPAWKKYEKYRQSRDDRKAHQGNADLPELAPWDYMLECKLGAKKITEAIVARFSKLQGSAEKMLTELLREKKGKGPITTDLDVVRSRLGIDYSALHDMQGFAKNFANELHEEEAPKNRTKWNEDVAAALELEDNEERRAAVLASITGQSNKAKEGRNVLVDLLLNVKDLKTFAARLAEEQRKRELLSFAWYMHNTNEWKLMIDMKAPIINQHRPSGEKLVITPEMLAAELQARQDDLNSGRKQPVDKKKQQHNKPRNTHQKSKQKKSSGKARKTDHSKKDKESKAKCNRCNRKGHYERDCKQKERTCYRCNQVGHVISECPSQE